VPRLIKAPLGVEHSETTLPPTQPILFNTWRNITISEQEAPARVFCSPILDIGTATRVPLMRHTRAIFSGGCQT
jgi:hypothetical protein